MYPEPTGEVRMSLSLRFAAGSHKGMIREGNEDSGYAGPRLLAIADGMGGQAAGEVASSEVISTLVTLDDDVPGSDILTSLATAVQHANDQLRVMVEEDPQLEGMGTTLTALLWTGQRLGLVHVGDSRAYLLRDGLLSQITQDHTWVQRLVDEGRITEEEAGTHPQRSLLMRALDGRGQVEPDLSIREVRAGDRYLVCSDGLSGVVSHETIEDTLASYQGPYETVQELIQLALRGGGPDNITCIVADVFDLDDGDTLGGMVAENPVVVGAVAENPHGISDPRHLQTPAGRASELGRQVPPQTAAPEGAFGPPDSAELTMTGAPLGAFGAYEEPEGADAALGSAGGEGHARPKKRRTGLKITLFVLVVLALLGGGAYGGYQWTQTQYYVGANGDHVAVYRGISQNLLGLNLSSVHQDYPQVELKYLPTYQRSQVQGTITASSLTDATTKAQNLQQQATVCKTLADATDAKKTSPSPSPSSSTKPGSNSSGRNGSSSSSTTSNHQPVTTPTPTPSPGPTLSPDEQKLASQCGGGQQ
ncbi:PP2C family protein-serine/threonine phosphatase [Streptomyces humicola]|nr:PP2C family serine/threonine-protein phosphatase [Streptomyces humicola]